MQDGIGAKLGAFTAAVAIEQAAALMFLATLRAPARVRVAALASTAAVALLAPLMLPADARLLRCLAAIAAVTAVLRMYDLHVGASRGVIPGFASFAASLPNIFCLVHRKAAKAPRPAAGLELRRILFATAAALLAVAAFVGAFLVDWTRFGFALEHAAKVLLFFLVLVPFLGAASSAWRLLGGSGLDFMDNPFAARTPADFWRRYNRPVHQFLHEDVFVPSGGRRHPVGGVILVFAVSAAVHEYVFTISIGRVQGYQTAFFLLQGAAVAATIRVKPTRLAASAWVALTFSFNLASGVLFFASVNEVLPFYRNRVRLWDS